MLMERNRSMARSGGGFTLIYNHTATTKIYTLSPHDALPISQAREKARTTTCISNLRQIGLANGMYVQDYHERFPFASRDCPPAAFVDVWNGLGPYMKNTKMFFCKSDTAPGSNIRWSQANSKP